MKVAQRKFFSLYSTFSFIHSMHEILWILFFQDGLPGFIHNTTPAKRKREGKAVDAQHKYNFNFAAAGSRVGGGRMRRE